MRCVNLNSLRGSGGNLVDNVLGYLDKTTSTVATPATRGWILNGRRDEVFDLLDFCRLLGISLDWICFELN